MLALLLRGCRAPLLDKLLVGKGFDEHSADHASSLETTLLTSLRVVPVRQGNAARSFVHPLKHWGNNRFELGLGGRERCCPKRPIKLRVVSARIQGQTVAVQFALV